MKTRKLLVILTVVCLPAVLMAGSLSAPADLTVNFIGDDIVLAWSDVTGATKYSVDFDVLVTYVDPTYGVLTEYVELSYSTFAPELTISFDDFIYELATELGIDPSAILGFTASARVKALNPGKGNGPQNNPFSEPVTFSVAFVL